MKRYKVYVYNTVDKFWDCYEVNAIGPVDARNVAVQMKVNGITISKVILRNVLANMILNGNEWDGSGTSYMYVVSQNYMTDDGHINTENWKLRILKRDNLELVTEAEFSKEGKIFQEALKYLQPA